MSELPAAVGVALHSGWAILTTVACPDGPRVLDRRRAALVSPDLPSQPHHHEASGLPPVEAEALVSEVARSAEAHAREALGDLREAVAPRARLVAAALPEARPLPATVAEILASPRAALIADAEMYRRALAAAASALGLEVVAHARRGEEQAAAGALGVARERVARRLAELGRELGPPWRRDHRDGAAAALAALARSGRVRL